MKRVVLTPFLTLLLEVGFPRLPLPEPGAMLPFSAKPLQLHFAEGSPKASPRSVSSTAGGCEAPPAPAAPDQSSGGIRQLPIPSPAQFLQLCLFLIAFS